LKSKSVAQSSAKLFPLDSVASVNWLTNAFASGPKGDGVVLPLCENCVYFNDGVCNAGHAEIMRRRGELGWSCQHFMTLETKLDVDEKSKEEADAQEIKDIPPEELAEIEKEMGIRGVQKTLGLTIKHDDTNKVIQFLAMLLAYTEDSQINISNRGPSSSGKSYIPIELASLYFPRQDVVMIAYSSPTAFFHDQGEWDDVDRVIRINLDRKILVFLDQPHDELLKRLRPLLSHDRKELLVKITDKREKKGMRTKNVKLIGFPSVFFCTGSLRVDEQESTRNIVLSPETTTEKIRESLYLKAARKGNPRAFKQLLDNDCDRKRLQKRILLIKHAGVKQIILNEPAKIVEKFITKYPKLKPRHARDLERLVSLAQALALFNLWHRKKDAEGNIYVNEEDIENAFAIYGEIAECQELGIPPYLHQMFKDIIEPLYLEKNSECKGGEGTLERYSEYRSGEGTPKGLARKEIIARHFDVYGRPLPEWLLRQEILPTLESVGLVFEEEDPDNRRRKLIYVGTPTPTPTLTISNESGASQPQAGQRTLGACEQCGAEITGATIYAEDGTRLCEKCASNYGGRL
jgi:hypothetical protein